MASSEAGSAGTYGVRRMSERVVEIGEERLLKARRVYRLHLEGSPLEIAEALRDLIETHGWDYGEVSEATGISKGQISKYLSLLRLEPEFQRLLEDGRMAWTTGYILATLPAEDRKRLLAETRTEDRITIKMAEALRREAHIKNLEALETDITAIASLQQPPEAKRLLEQLESVIKAMNPPEPIIVALETIKRWLT